MTVLEIEAKCVIRDERDGLVNKLAESERDAGEIRRKLDLLLTEQRPSRLYVLETEIGELKEALRKEQESSFGSDMALREKLTAMALENVSVAAKLAESERKLAELDALLDLEKSVRALRFSYSLGANSVWTREIDPLVKKLDVLRLTKQPAAKEPTEGEPAKPAQQTDQKPAKARACDYHVPEYYDPVTGDTHPGTDADCDQPATHLSCMPYTGTPTCAEHSCRCAKPLAAPPAQAEQLSPPMTPAEMFGGSFHDTNPAGERGGFRVGQRVRDKRRCCVGTVIQNDKVSHLGYTLVVDWDTGYRNTQHPDDLVPENEPDAMARQSQPQGDGRVDYITRSELASLLRSAGAETAAEHCKTGTFGPVGGGNL